MREEKYGIELLSDNFFTTLNQTHTENLRKARKRKKYPREDSFSVSIGIPGENLGIYSPENYQSFGEYLEIMEGINSGELALYTGDDMDNDKFSESIDVYTSFPRDSLSKVHNALDPEFEVKQASLAYMGYGDDPFEAYNNIDLATSFLANDGENNIWLTVAPIDDGLEARDVGGERTIEVYEILENIGVAHSDIVMTGDKDTEWLVETSPVDLDDWR